MDKNKVPRNLKAKTLNIKFPARLTEVADLSSPSSWRVSKQGYPI